MKDKGFIRAEDFPKIEERVEKQPQNKINKVEKKQRVDYSKDVISLALKKHGKR